MQCLTIPYDIWVLDLEKRKTDFWNLLQKNWNALFAYVYSVKYPIFMHYVTITSSGMYSIDTCARSHNCL